VKTEAIEDRAHAALKYLTDTDELAADLKHEADKAEHVWQGTIDSHFLVETGNNEERKANARKQAEPRFLEYLEAQRKYDAVANRRKSEALAVEWCRSLYSNYRQGK
jgi:hypothetical protein